MMKIDLVSWNDMFVRRQTRFVGFGLLILRLHSYVGELEEKPSTPPQFSRQRFLLMNASFAFLIYVSNHVVSSNTIYSFNPIQDGYP